jgi:carboxypeptidase C (cathepsin A)
LAKQVAEFTGLSAELVLEHNLRIGSEDFAHALLADQRLIISPYDARDTLPVRATQGFSSMADPGSAASSSQLSVALHDYMRRDLGIATPRAYDEVHYSLSSQWHWEGQAAGPYWNSAPYLTDLMAQNPKLRVFVVGGYYDLVTPVFAAERSLLHAGLPRDRVVLHYYQGGHAAYVGEDNLREISRDIHAFIGK